MIITTSIKHAKQLSTSLYVGNILNTARCLSDYSQDPNISFWHRLNQKKLSDYSQDPNMSFWHRQ